MSYSIIQLLSVGLHKTTADRYFYRSIVCNSCQSIIYFRIISLYVSARSHLADYQNKPGINIRNPVFMDDPGIAHNSHNHTTGGCVLFSGWFFLARKPQNFDQIGLFCSKFTCFLAYFLQALIMWRCTNIDKYEVWTQKILCKLIFEYLLIL